MAYPDLLASGMTAEGTFDPAELFAGEGKIVTTNGVCGASSITQLQVVARSEDGLIVPYNELTGTASKAGTFTSTGVDTDTVTINGQAITLKPAASAQYDITIGGTATLTATALAAKINQYPDTFNVRAVRAGAVVTVYALQPGAGGNSIAIAKAFTTAGDFTWAGGATALSGGADETEAKAIGIAAQAATVGEGVPYFSSGVFNANLIVWPAELTTLAQRQAVFDRTPIGIAVPKGVSTYMTIPT